MPESSAAAEAKLAVLRQGLTGLIQHIQKIRDDVAAIRYRQGTGDTFSAMSDELDAIVNATEQATNQIMENVEQIDTAVSKARESVQDPEAQAALGAVPDMVGNIFEACSFQDITGQRITKVVRALTHIEERVDSMIALWGEEAIQKAHAAAQGSADNPLLQGPQHEGEGASQHEVDRLLAGENTVAEDVDARAAALAAERASRHAKAEHGKDRPAPSQGGEDVSQDDIDKLLGFD